MAAFDAEVAVPPQVAEGAESVSIIVQGGDAAVAEPSATKKRVITSKARVIKK